MMGLRNVVPSAIVLLLALLAALPWGVGGDLRLVLPLLPTAVILAWSLRRRAAVPEVIAFLAGLVLDALSHGPLGYWALVNLVALVLAALLRNPQGAAPLARFLRFAVGTGMTAAVAWTVSSLYALQVGELRPLASAAVMVVLTWPLLAGLMAALDPPRTVAANGNLVRGGGGHAARG